MSQFASLFIICLAIISAILRPYKTEYITTTQEQYLYSYQGYLGDPNTRPSYTKITMLQDTIAYSHQDTEGSRFRLMPTDNNGFCVELLLDSPFTFHPTQITKLTLQIGSDITTGPTNNCDLLISFQSNNTYISTLISIDESNDNKIYPSCDTTFPYTQSLPIGNIQDIVTNNVQNCDRLCKAFGNNVGSNPDFQ
eukprot:207066_1